MSRLISVALTEQAVIERRKTVTRRLGWRHAYPGMRLTLCRKVMGRKRADGTVEPLVRLAEVEIVDVRRERLRDITDEDVVLEGLDNPAWTADPWGPAGCFVAFFTQHMRCQPDTEVTRIEWRYLTTTIEEETTNGH